MKQLCDAPDLDIDGEYLKPHGDRCGLGSNLYAQDAELPQELLRHESIETSYESYREQNVTKRRERPEQALDVVSILSESELPPPRCDPGTRPLHDPADAVRTHQ